MSIAAIGEMVGGRWEVLAAAGILILTAQFLPKLLQAIRLSRIPMVAQELGGPDKRRQAYLLNARRIYNEGYRKFKEGMFRVTTPRNTPIVVLSPEFLPELKGLPDDVVSLHAAINETMEAKYSKVKTYIPIVPHTIRADLTPALVRLNPMIAQEVHETMDLEMPQCLDWTEVNIYHKLHRIVTMVSGRIFIGSELCRSEGYLKVMLKYTTDTMAAVKGIHRIHPWLRPFFARQLPAVKQFHHGTAQAYDFMAPVIDSRKKIAAEKQDEQPDDMLQWLVTNLGKFPDKNSQNIAQAQLGLSFAAIHTTTMTATNVFYDIAAMPDLVEELRKEAEQALAENGGIFTSNCLQSLKKLDSVLKESLRLSPASLASFQRKVLKPVTLSNGQTIPAGVTIEVPVGAMNFDPRLFPNPEKFEPLRFYKLRQEAKESGSTEGTALNQFVSVSQHSLTFGYGRHACPGRFFAANEIKMIVVNLIMRYDIRMEEGCTERYPNVEFAQVCTPDPKRNLLIKARSS